MKQMKTAIFSSNAYSGRGVSYACCSVARGLVANGIAVTVSVPSMVRKAEGVEYRPFFPGLWKHGTGRLLKTVLGPLHEGSYLRQIRGDQDRPAAYLWPDASPRLAMALKRSGLTVIREMINCHRRTAKGILDREYTRLRLPASHSISERSVTDETEMLRHCDCIFVPSPLVRESLLADGVPEEKIISVSYGWDPSRIRVCPPRRSDGDTVTAIFVGRIGLRKGAHIAVSAWLNSGVRGRLVLVGDMEPAMRRLIGGHIDGVRIVHHGFTDNIGAEYAEADLFFLPTLEEGGPMVTFEAAGSGLPLVVSPMGAGAAFGDRTGAIVVDPLDEEAIVGALRRLGGDPALRRELGAAAQARADDFVWAKIGAMRAERIRGLGN